ncbi:MAG: hypothetical protein Q9191_003529 [Dirinaria sp. TL-2023a]
MEQPQQTARGKEARYDDCVGKLEISYDDHVEIIEHRNIIAVREISTSGEEAIATPFYNILQLQTPTSITGEIPFCFEAIAATGLPASFLEKHLGLSKPPFLHWPSTDGKPNFHIVISVRSGLGEAEHFFAGVVRPALTAYGIQESQYNIVTTVSEKSVTELARQVILPRARAGIQQTILLLSGDGGIVDLVNVLQPHDPGSGEEGPFVRPLIGLVALGTGNALANSTGINSDATRGLRHFFRGEPQSLPTYVATFSAGSELLVNEGRDTEPLDTEDEDGNVMIHGAVVCSWGLHASLVADSDTTEYRKFGSDRFQMA